MTQQADEQPIEDDSIEWVYIDGLKYELNDLMEEVSPPE